MQKIKIGFISFAHMHAAHYFRLLRQRNDVEIVGISDPVEDRVSPFISEVPYYPDHIQLLEKDLDAVIICSENVHHASFTEDAAAYGKHVLCEKPLGLSIAEMQQMITVCRRQGVQLMTAFPNRYLQSVQRAKQAIEQQEIGEVIMIKGTNKGALPSGWFIDPALSGGGALFDHTVHVMDIIHWILGCKAEEVYAEVGNLFSNIPAEDSGMVHAKFENGTDVVLDTSWSRLEVFPYKRDITMEIIGTEGRISLDASKQINKVYNDRTGKVEWRDWSDDKEELMLDEFIKALKNKVGFPITGEDGLHSTAIALAAYESVKLGRPVKVDYGTKGD